MTGGVVPGSSSASLRERHREPSMRACAAGRVTFGGMARFFLGCPTGTPSGTFHACMVRRASCEWWSARFFLGFPAGAPSGTFHASMCGG
ncbi:hypothetical protein [Paenibacillus chibensis]|uniref:hypothetical protein n=1 Tax=Paenibacillus chibensis TaxID=59846 RepID=UPI0013E3A006|nr:hypothetical protein [Paenibacillus chibensis]